MSIEKATLNSYSLPNSTNNPALDVYSAALKLDPQNVIPANTHCDNCFNDATSEMKVFQCQHSVCQKCMDAYSGGGNNYYSPLFGQNLACPICCSDTKPLVNSHHFLHNGNPIPPSNGGYIPMHVYPPPGPPDLKSMGLDPFSSLLYPPLPPPPPRPPIPHMNGGHISPFQSYNGVHSSMKMQPNIGVPHCSPNLTTTMNNITFSNPVSHLLIPDPTRESVSTTPNSILPPPPAFNTNAMPTLTNAMPTLANAMPTLANAMPTLSNAMPTLSNAMPTLSNAMPTLVHTLPLLTPHSDSIQTSLPPDTIQNSSFLRPNLITTDSIQPAMPPMPTSTDPIQSTLPVNSLPSTSVPPTLQSILPSSSTSTSLTSSEVSSGSSNFSSAALDSPVLCSCDEGIIATAKCKDCEDYLCESCVKAHRKVRITREHKIIDLQTNELLDSSHNTSPSTTSCSPNSTKSSVTSPSGCPPLRFNSVLTLDEQIDGIETHGDCSKHEGDRLIYFCQTCGVLLCKSCLMNDHTHHNYGYIREMYDRFKPSIEELVSKTKVQVLLLENSIKAITKLNESVEQKSVDSLKKIEETVVQYTKALVAYEEELRNKVNSITEKRVESLKEQKSSLEGALQSLKTVSISAEKALKEQNKGEVLASRIHLVANLRDKNSAEFPRNPTEDDTYILKTSNSSVDKMLQSLVTVTTAPYAPLCTAEGDGLKRPKINKSCNIVVTTKDRNSDPCIECKEKLFVQMKSGDGHNVPVEVTNDEEGIYTLNFKPRVAGEHQLIVAIRGQHINGSPFILPIDGGRDYAKISSSIPFCFGSEGADEGMFCRPWGVCTNSEGDLIIGDRSNHRIQLFTSSGTFKSQFGEEGIRQGQFCRPAGVATTKEDNIVVADKDNHRVQVFKKDASFLFTFGTKGSNDNQMIYPYDVTVTPDNDRIVVSDSGNHRLLIFNTLGVLLAKFGYKGYLCGNFDSPRGVTVNDEGHIILTDFNVHHILVIHPNGRTAQIIGGQGSGNGQLMRPQGLAVDNMGNIVVADTRNHRIIVFHPNGHFVAKYGSHGQGPGEFDRPTAVTVLPDGKFAVVDFGNSRIQIF